MTTVVFVHGTGVREPAYTRTLELIRSKLGARLDVELVGCDWGGPLGARLHWNGRSIPDYDTTRAAEASEEEDAVALWALLYRDPLYELRLLSLAGRRPTEMPPGGEAPGAHLDRRVVRLAADGELGAALRDAGIEETHLSGARVAVRGSRPYREAIRAAPSALQELRLAVARAIVAETIVRAQVDTGPLLDGRARDLLVEQVAEALGGGERGAAGWAARNVVEMTMRLGAAGYLQRRRRSVTDAIYPSAGDILLYQARGQGIRDAIAGRIRHSGDDVVVLAHSLGGVASVDLLVREHLPQVRLLVTVGSQAPFFYEIGALWSLRPNEPLPDRFPPAWLNLYDPRDLLSYVGEEVFGQRVEDVRVDNGQPFPYAHSAYWRNPRVWQAVIAGISG
jgi:hypothetical protein